MPLTDTAIRGAKSGSRPIKLSDGEGMFLLIQPNGARLWRLSYRFGGKQKTIGLGAYTNAGSNTVRVSLAQARERRTEARRLLAQGSDPSAVRQAEAAAAAAEAETFAKVAEEWLAKERRENRAEVTLSKIEWLIGMLARELGALPIASIEPPDLLRALRQIEAKGLHETCRRARSVAGRIFRYGVATGRCARDPSSDLRGAITTPTVTSRAAVTDPPGLGALLRAIDTYSSPVTRSALLFCALTAARPGEVRHCEWTEIENGVWSP